MQNKQTIRARISGDAYAEIKAAADKLGVSISAYIRMTVLRAARADTKYEAVR